MIGNPLKSKFPSFFSNEDSSNKIKIFSLGTEEPQEWSILSDIDGTLIFNNGKLNEALLTVLKMAGVKTIYLFSTMTMKEVDETVANPDYFSRKQLIDALEKLGFIVRVMTPVDPFYKKEIGKFYDESFAVHFEAFANGNLTEKNISTDLSLQKDRIKFGIYDAYNQIVDSIISGNINKNIEILKKIPQQFYMALNRLKETFAEHKDIVLLRTWILFIQEKADQLRLIISNLGKLLEQNYSNEALKVWLTQQPEFKHLPLLANTTNPNKFWEKGSMWAYWRSLNPDQPTLLFDDLPAVLETAKMLDKKSDPNTHLITVYVNGQSPPSEFYYAEIFAPLYLNFCLKFVKHTIEKTFKSVEPQRTRISFSMESTQNLFPATEEYTNLKDRLNTILDQTQPPTLSYMLKILRLVEALKNKLNNLSQYQEFLHEVQQMQTLIQKAVKGSITLLVAEIQKLQPNGTSTSVSEQIKNTCQSFLQIEYQNINSAELAAFLDKMKKYTQMREREPSVAPTIRKRLNKLFENTEFINHPWTALIDTNLLINPVQSLALLKQLTESAIKQIYLLNNTLPLQTPKELDALSLFLTQRGFTVLGKINSEDMCRDDSSYQSEIYNIVDLILRKVLEGKINQAELIIQFKRIESLKNGWLDMQHKHELNSNDNNIVFSDLKEIVGKLLAFSDALKNQLYNHLSADVTKKWLNKVIETTFTDLPFANFDEWLKSSPMKSKALWDYWRSFSWTTPTVYFSSSVTLIKEAQEYHQQQSIAPLIAVHVEPTQLNFDHKHVRQCLASTSFSNCLQIISDMILGVVGIPVSNRSSFRNSIENLTNKVDKSGSLRKSLFAKEKKEKSEKFVESKEYKNFMDKIKSILSSEMSPTLCEMKEILALIEQSNQKLSDSKILEEGTIRLTFSQIQILIKDTITHSIQSLVFLYPQLAEKLAHKGSIFHPIQTHIEKYLKKPSLASLDEFVTSVYELIPKQENQTLIPEDLRKSLIELVGKPTIFTDKVSTSELVELPGFNSN